MQMNPKHAGHSTASLTHSDSRSHTPRSHSAMTDRSTREPQYTIPHGTPGRKQLEPLSEPQSRTNPARPRAYNQPQSSNQPSYGYFYHGYQPSFIHPNHKNMPNNSSSQKKPLAFPTQASIRGDSRAQIPGPTIGRSYSGMQSFATNSRLSVKLPEKKLKKPLKRRKSIRRSVVNPVNDNQACSSSKTANGEGKNKYEPKATLDKRRYRQAKPIYNFSSLNKRKPTGSTKHLIDPSQSELEIYDGTMSRDYSKASEDTYMSNYTEATNRTVTATDTTPPDDSPLRCDSPKQHDVYIKEYSAPLIFQSSADLECEKAICTRKETRFASVRHLYAILFGLGFLFVPFWVAGFIIALLASRSSKEASDLPDVPKNPSHARWKTRFLIATLVWIILALALAIVAIVTHPNWFPFRSKISTLNKSR